MEWVWIVIMGAPLFYFGKKSRDLQRMADRHRRSDAGAAGPQWNPHDLFDPGLYTEEGNRLRQQALLFYIPIPLGWVVLALMLWWISGKFLQYVWPL